MDARAPRGPARARSPLVRHARPRKCAAGDPVATQCSWTERARAWSLVPRATREWSCETSPPIRLPRPPPPECSTPTRDIRARARRPDSHVKRHKSRVERLPIRPSCVWTLKPAPGPNVDRPSTGVAEPTNDPAAPRRRGGRTIAVPLGRVAQWESARFTRERSQVRNPPRPLETSPGASRGEAGRTAHRLVAARAVLRASDGWRHAAWLAGSLLITCSTHSPVIWRVAALIRFQVLIVAIESTSAASWASS